MATTWSRAGRWICAAGERAGARCSGAVLRHEAANEFADNLGHKTERYESQLI